VYELMRKGELPSYRDGRSRKILLKAIRDRIDRLTQADKEWHPLVVNPPRRQRKPNPAAEHVEA
jgi:hypothetical protein